MTNGAERTFSVGPVNSSDNGTVFRCAHLITADQSPTLTVLIMQSKKKTALFIINHFILVLFTYLYTDSPEYTISPDQPTTVVEGDNYTYTFDLTAFPSPTDYNWTKDGVDTDGNGCIVLGKEKEEPNTATLLFYIELI